jgi:hypothetical protein
MACFVFRSDIGLGFDDPSDGCTIRMLSHQVLAKQLPGNIKGGFLVERTRDFHGLREDFLQPLGKLFAKSMDLARIVFRGFPLEYVERHFLQRC